LTGEGEGGGEKDRIRLPLPSTLFRHFSPPQKLDIIEEKMIISYYSPHRREAYAKG
jgi:hypothetical protein